MTYSDTIYIQQALARLEVAYMELSAELNHVKEEIEIVSRLLKALEASSGEMTPIA